jgi:phytoene desaturase
MKTRGNIGIIGAGLGGLSAAVHLARKGFKVSVFEKNNYIGGKAGSLVKNGFRFDTGPSLLTMPFILNEIFELNDENIDEYLTIRQLKTTCKYFYPDGSIINSYASPEDFAGEVESKTSDSRMTLKKYLNYCGNIYNLTSDLFLFNPEMNIYTFLNRKALKSMLNFSRVDPFRTMHEANRSFFNDHKMVQLFDRFATYNGSNPYRAPATLNIIPYVELSLGSYVVEEGISAIASGLKVLAEKNGVRFLLNQQVDKILTKNDKAMGIRSNEKDYFFDSVVSNVDVNYTYNNLLDYNFKNRNEPSLSGIVFYWGVKGNHPSLEIHNILFSENYKNEFDDIFHSKKCPEDPTVYIYISSKYKKDDAPKGFENWFVMVNTPHNLGQNWNGEVGKMRVLIKKKVERILGIDISEKILFEEVLTPSDIERNTGSFQGSIYGSSSNSRNSAFRRNPVKSKSYTNLYFCGGSVHPGGGIPLVLLSGKHASELIIRDLN